MPQQALDHIQNCLEETTTVPQIRALLVELLPVLTADLVALGRRTLNE